VDLGTGDTVHVNLPVAVAMAIHSARRPKSTLGRDRGLYHPEEAEKIWCSSPLHWEAEELVKLPNCWMIDERKRPSYARSLKPALPPEKQWNLKGELLSSRGCAGNRRGGGAEPGQGWDQWDCDQLS
jgi:hypothetical protein